MRRPARNARSGARSCARDGARDGARDERGQATVLIIGLAVALLMLVAVVVDASAAYLERQGLDTLADGAALRGADLGATGEETYTTGVPDERLRLTADQVRRSVAAYLSDVGAYRSFPGLAFDVGVDPVQRRVTVRLRAPIDLPLHVPGSPGRAAIGARGAAVVSVDPPQ